MVGEFMAASLASLLTIWSVTTAADNLILGADIKELRIMNRPVKLQREAKQGLKNDVSGIGRPELEPRAEAQKTPWASEQSYQPALDHFSLGSEASTGVIMNDDKLASTEATGIDRAICPPSAEVFLDLLGWRTEEEGLSRGCRIDRIIAARLRQRSSIQNNGYQCSRLKSPNVFNRHLLTILPYVHTRMTSAPQGADSEGG